MSIERDSKKIAELLGENGIVNLISSLASGFGIFEYFEEMAKTVYLSSAIKETLGFTKDIPVKSSEAGVDYYVHPDDMAIIRRDMERPRDVGEIYDIDLRLLSGDGSYRWFNIRVVLSKIENRHEIWYGVYTDISARKESELGLSRIYQTMNGAYAIVEYSKKTGFKILFTTEEVTKATGDVKAGEEQNTDDIFDRAHPDDREIMRFAFSQAIKTTGKIQREFRMRMSDGSYKWIKPNLAVSNGDDGKKLLYGTFTNIDELIQTHLEVENERKRLRSVIEQASIAVIDWDQKSGKYYMSDRFKAYAMSKSADKFINKKQGDTSIVHPDDLTMLEEFFAESLRGEPYASVTVRAKMTDGSYRWTMINGYFTRDELGAPLRSIVTLVDVEDERSLEMEMQLNLRRLETVIEDTNAQYWEYDIINDVAYIGDIVRKVYSLPEVMENYPNSLINTGIIPDEYVAGFRKMHINLKNGALFGEQKLPMNSPGGSVRWKHVRYRTIFNSESKPSRAIGTAIDITEQVNAETKLKQYKLAQKQKQQEAEKK